MSSNSTPETISIVFRSYNEERWLGEALASCRRQVLDDGVELEIVLVDSGSTDSTVEIAESFGCRVVHIRKSEFTFGRSLNIGCDAATGEYLVFISAHCIPVHDRWLTNLIQPLRHGSADYVYGRQIGHKVSRYSEHQVFAQYFPPMDKLPQDGFFTNNANAAIRTSLWKKHKFDEKVTGLEDMVLAKAIVEEGGATGYVADAPVYHIHEESLAQIRRRYYREALTLRDIMPEIHFNFGDFLRYFFAGIFNDFSYAIKEKKIFREASGIVTFRFMQYWGNYRGHNEHRVLSRQQKESYYYPSPRRGSEKKSSWSQHARHSAAKTDA